MIIAHISVSGLPSEGASVGHYVRRAVEVIRASGVKHEVHAMGTELECERWSDLWRIVEAMDAALGEMGAQRVMVQLKLDHRRDKPTSLSGKVRSATRTSAGQA